MTSRAAIALAALLLLLVVGPASAQVVHVSDPAGDGRLGHFGDIGRVDVNHAPRKVYVTIRPAKGGQLAHFYDVWFDTKKDVKGPEFTAGVYLETTTVVVARVHGFTIDGRRTCSLKHGASVTGKVVTLTIPRTCLAIAGDEPGRLRVSVRSSEEEGDADWAPGVKRFSPWVLHEL